MQRITFPHSFLILIVCLLVQPARLSVAQQTNMELFQQMAIECLGPIPATHRSFKLSSSDTSTPFIKSSLIQHWQDKDYTVYVADSSFADATDSLPVFTYSIGKSEVTYERLRKKQVKRAVHLTSHYTLTLEDGQIVGDDVCSKTMSDSISRESLQTVEDVAFAVTRAPHPAQGWFQRYLEPVVLTTATVLGVYLFFTLRSDSNDDGS